MLDYKKEEKMKYLLVLITALIFSACASKVAVVEIDDKFAIARSDSNNKVEFKYDNIFDYNKKYFKVKLADKYGIVEKASSKEIISPIYDSISNLYNGYAIVERNGKYGVVNASMKGVLKPIYQKIVIIEDNKFIVKNDDFYGCMNNKGEFDLKANYDMIYNIVEGYARIELDSKWGFMDAQCKISTYLKYDYVNGFPRPKMHQKLTQNNNQWSIPSFEQSDW